MSIVSGNLCLKAVVNSRPIVLRDCALIVDSFIVSLETNHVVINHYSFDYKSSLVGTADKDDNKICL